MNRSALGILLKDWRSRRRISQLDLAHKVGVSARHLSFVETGRSKPSPELVLALGIELDVPLREQNTMLLAAGYAPRWRETDLGAPESASARAAVERLLEAHDPYPGLVVDRLWNVVSHNQGAGRLIADLPVELLTPPINVYRLSLHPDGLARNTLNLVDWGRTMLAQLRRDVAITGDPRLEALLTEIGTYPTAKQILDAGEGHRQSGDVLVPFDVVVDGRHMSFFTTLTTFGTPRDITFDEIVVELFYPADEATTRLLSG